MVLRLPLRYRVLPTQTRLFASGTRSCRTKIEAIGVEMSKKTEMNNKQSGNVEVKPRKRPPPPLVIPPEQNGGDDDPEALVVNQKYNRLTCRDLAKLMPNEWPQVMKLHVNSDHLMPNPWS